MYKPYFLSFSHKKKNQLKKLSFEQAKRVLTKCTLLKDFEKKQEEEEGVLSKIGH